MQELRAQIQASRICSSVDAQEDVYFIANPLSQAQLRLADAIRKLAEHAERNGIELDMDVQVLLLCPCSPCCPCCTCCLCCPCASAKTKVLYN